MSIVELAVQWLLKNARQQMLHMRQRSWKGTNNKKDNLLSEKASAEINYNIKLLLFNLINDWKMSSIQIEFLCRTVLRSYGSTTERKQDVFNFIPI